MPLNHFIPYNGALKPRWILSLHSPPRVAITNHQFISNKRVTVFQQ